MDWLSRLVILQIATIVDVRANTTVKCNISGLVSLSLVGPAPLDVLWAPSGALLKACAGPHLCPLQPLLRRCGPEDVPDLVPDPADCWHHVEEEWERRLNGLVWAEAAATASSTWSQLSNGARLVFAGVVPFFVLVLVVVNMFTLYIIHKISRGMGVNPYLNHSALVMCDFALLLVGTFRLYYDFSGLLRVLEKRCVSASVVISIEPILVGILSADQLFVLLVTLDQLFLLTYPQHYTQINSPLKTAISCLSCIAFSEALTFYLLNRQVIENPYGCGLLATLAEQGTPPPDLAAALVPRPSDTHDTFRGFWRGDTHDAMNCAVIPNPRAWVFYIFSFAISVILLCSSWSLHRAYARLHSAKRQQSAVAGGGEEEEEEEEGTGRGESGFPSIILAEAGLAFVQTTATVALLAWTTNKFTFLDGIMEKNNVTQVLEISAYGVAFFEVVSHFVFFLVLSRKFRAAAWGVLAGLLYLPPDPVPEAHTMHTVGDARVMPPKAAKNLTVEDIS